MKTNFLTRLMNLLVNLLLILMVLSLFTLPILVDKYEAIAGVGASSPTQWITVFLYLTAIPFLILLMMAKKLCINILQNQPFSASSIRALNVISVCAFMDFLLYAMGTIMILRNLLSLTLMVAAFMIGIVSLILSQLIKMAKEIKDENDLTI